MSFEKAETYDKAAWHSDAVPDELPPDNCATHIGMFLAWAIINNLESQFHCDESGEELAAVRERKMTGRDFLFQACDTKFTDEDLNDEGNKFAAAYYLGKDRGGSGRFFDDFATLSFGLPSIYHVKDTWGNFDRLARIIDKRFREWKTSSSPNFK